MMNTYFFNIHNIKMITFVLCNIFEQIWQRESILVTSLLQNRKCFVLPTYLLTNFYQLDFAWSTCQYGSPAHILLFKMPQNSTTTHQLAVWILSSFFVKYCIVQPLLDREAPVRPFHEFYQGLSKHIAPNMSPCKHHNAQCRNIFSSIYLFFSFIE